MNASVRHPVRLAAALVALLMLSCAFVRSTVMQVAMAAAPVGAPMCDGGMAMRAGDTSGRLHALRVGLAKGAQAPRGACPYCAAAAQPPIPCVFAPVLSSAAVQFVAYRVQALHTARGPPSRRPRARDPPALVLAI